MVAADRPNADTFAGLGITAESTLPPATVVGEFLLDRVIASGGFGQVYRARHRDTGRVVAVKVLHSDLCNAPNAVARFLREAEVMVRLRHRNIVELVAWGTVSDGRPYLVMEFLTGTDLSRVVADHGRQSLDGTLAIIAPICQALAVAHHQDIVHRDVKISNVFLATDDAGDPRVVLIDFGIAKLAAPGTSDLTTSRQLVGTPVTMSPEQIVGGKVDARTDVYGLGVMTFHLLTGRLPFEDESATIVTYLHAHARRPKVSSFASVPIAIDDVVMRAMAIDPAHRYPRVEDFAAALALAAAVDGPIETPLVPRPAVAIWVEIRGDDDAMLDPDDAMLADLMSLLPIAETALTATGFGVVMQSGNSLLVARPIAGTDDSARTAAIERARELAIVLDQRPDRDPRIEFVIVVHFGIALCAGDAVRAGELIDVGYWSPDPSVRGVVATRPALEGLAVASREVSDSRVWAIR